MPAAAALALTVAFAFPSRDGSRLLAASEIPQPGTLRTALCSGAPPVMVEFERSQGDPARAVFRVVGPRVNARATCLLADESVLTGAALLPLKPAALPAPCSPSLYPGFQEARSRPVVACWLIGEGSHGARAAVVEFARFLSHALASLVIIDGDRRIYVDYPAEFKGPGADLWRVGDGGEIHAERFDVIFLLKRGSTYLLGVDWRGSEGSVLSVLTCDSGDRFREVIREITASVTTASP